MEWRAISEAPPLKENVMVIWFDPSDGDYDGPEEACFISPTAYYGSTSNLRRKGQGVNWPTHWAPRPAPPA